MQTRLGNQYIEVSLRAVTLRLKYAILRRPVPEFTGAALLVMLGGTWGLLREGANHTASLAILAMAILLGISGIAAASREVASERATVRIPQRSWWILAALLMLHAGIAGRIALSAPPHVDCYTFERDAAESMLHGVDPFGSTHADIYDAPGTSNFYGPGVVVDGRVQVGLQYPPLTLLCLVPGYLLGDIRFGFVLAILLSGILVFAVAPNSRGPWLAGFLLLNPLTFFVEYQCWTESLVWVLLCATVYTAVKRPRWLPLALGLFLASKQYNVLALPFIGLLVSPFTWRRYWGLLGSSLAIAAATVLPFALWNFRALWHDLVLFHLAQPFRHDAISFAVPFPLALKMGPLLLAGFVAWVTWRGTHHAAMFAAAFGLALLLFFSTSKQAFLNYHFLIWQALLLAAAIWPATDSRHAEGRAAEATDSRATSVHA